MIPVFIGYDSRESLAYHVLAHSIMRRASRPVYIAPLMLSQLNGLLIREKHPLQSTEFAFSRFLVPYLCGYSGFAIFMDCDMLVRCDIAELLDAATWGAAVSVVQHNYTPLGETKFLDQPQTAYPRKNWSSVMVFNCEKCRALTPRYVNEASGLDLHRFNWIKDDEIGELPRAWNHLVGEYEPNPDAKIVHFTTGGPWFRKYECVEFSDEWRAELGHMNGS